MSVRLMAVVWTLALDHARQSVLLALADHAHDDGTNARPSLGYVAWKTGYSLRSVKRLVATLREEGVIQVTEQGGGRMATVYMLCLDRVKVKAPYKPLRSGMHRGQNDTGDTGDTSGGTPVTPQPSVNHQTTDEQHFSLAVRTSRAKTSRVKKAGPVSEAVDAYRAVVGARRSDRDGGVLAALVSRHGREAVLRTIESERASILAADSPLLFLAGRFRRGRNGATPETIDERAARYLREDQEAAARRAAASR